MVSIGVRYEVMHGLSIAIFFDLRLLSEVKGQGQALKTLQSLGMLEDGRRDVTVTLRDRATRRH